MLEWEVYECKIRPQIRRRTVGMQLMKLYISKQEGYDTKDTLNAYIHSHLTLDTDSR